MIGVVGNHCSPFPNTFRICSFGVGVGHNIDMLLCKPQILICNLIKRVPGTLLTSLGTTSSAGTTSRVGLVNSSGDPRCWCLGRLRRFLWMVSVAKKQLRTDTLTKRATLSVIIQSNANICMVFCTEWLKPPDLLLLVLARAFVFLLGFLAFQCSVSLCFLW